MTFNDIYNQFIKSTKENFPVDVCIKQNERESNVFDSNVPYLCLVIDKRFDNYGNNFAQILDICAPMCYNSAHPCAIIVI